MRPAFSCVFEAGIFSARRCCSQRQCNAGEDADGCLCRGGQVRRGGEDRAESPRTCAGFGSKGTRRHEPEASVALSSSDALSSGLNHRSREVSPWPRRPGGLSPPDHWSIQRDSRSPCSAVHGRLSRCKAKLAKTLRLHLCCQSSSKLVAPGKQHEEAQSSKLKAQSSRLKGTSKFKVPMRPSIRSVTGAWSLEFLLSFGF